DAAGLDGQGIGTLDFVAGPYATAADDALGRVVGEVGIGCVGGVIQVVGAIEAIAHVPQAHHAGHVLQLAVAVGRTGEAVQRVVGDVELHDIAPQLVQFSVFRADHHAFFDGRGAGRGMAPAAFDFHQAQAAGTEIG